MTNSIWTTDNIPDQKGRTILITGANSGIGFETAKALAAKNGEIVLAVRDLEKGEAAKALILTEHNNAKIQVMLLDLMKLESVKSFAESFKKAHSKLDLLINNAGIMVPPYEKTVDGFESQFGTNHLGHFALTAQLFEVLKGTPNSRIVNVSSNAHKMGTLNFDDLSWENRRYIAWKAYGDSKIANLYFSYELSRRIQASKLQVLVTAAHPGLTRTNLAKSKLLRGLNVLIAQSMEMGALPTLMAAVEPTAQSGDYFGPSNFSEWRGYPKQVQSNKLSHNMDIAARLWSVSEKLTGFSFEI